MEESLSFLVTFLVTFLVALCVVLPLTVKRGVRASAHPVFEEVPPEDERIPPSARGFFREVAEDLELLGFGPVACVISTDIAPNTTTYVAVFENRQAGDAAAATAVFSKMPLALVKSSYVVEFSTEFADRTEVHTNNVTAPSFFGSVPWRTLAKLPAMADVGLLYRVHLGLVARRGDAVVKTLPDAGAHAAAVREGALREFESQVELGRLRLDARRETYRLTWRGVVHTIASSLWPFSAIGRWLVKRRAKALLEGMGLEARYQTVDYRRRATHYAQLAAEALSQRTQPAQGMTPVAPSVTGGQQPVFNCPACGGLIAADQPPGAEVRCPLCQQVIRVPGAGRPPGTPPTEPVLYADIDQRPLRRGLAVAALVCGIAGLVPLCFPVNLIGLILGVVAVRRAARQPLLYGGKGMAIGGICTGVIGLLLSVLMYGVLFGPAAVSEPFSRWFCQINVVDIGTAMSDYAEAHNGAFPPDFETLIDNGALGEADFWCPNSDPESTDIYECYQYIDGQTTADDAGNVLVYEKPECHAGEGGSVLFLDGRAGFVEPYERVEELIRETRGRLAGPSDD
ncbi:MAG TPA: DUF4190 domain-containing protein [Phycisphaerae bacterium]|nr:DUF4190 domain-containing protein [Phycisphaerae bacterium]